MMHRFLANNRDELVARCKTKVAQRPLRAATEEQLKNGVPMFLEQLRRTLAAEEDGQAAQSLEISGSASGVDAATTSEMGVSATAHGKQLLELGYTVDQVVHDYGDLCQAITDLAFERDAPFGIAEFRTLNRCLDNAIAAAVTEFSFQREATSTRKRDEERSQRLGFLVHELRNSIGTAMMATGALELGGLPLGGATGAVLKRSLATLKTLVDGALAEAKGASAVAMHAQVFDVATFIADATSAASLYAHVSGTTLTVAEVDSRLYLSGNRELLLSALANLLQNAFKFTHPRSEITLSASSFGHDVVIDVADHCGGLPADARQRMFQPFAQHGGDKSGLGLGLCIARQSVEADGGTLTVRDVPGTGCIFTLTLPRYIQL